MGPHASLTRGAVVALALCAAGGVGAQQAPNRPPAAMAAPQPLPDGSRDFDWEIGEWTTHLKRLDKPLSGSTTWVEYTGTTVVRGILNGRANLAELVVEGPSGRIEGASLRLYDTAAREWTLNYFTIGGGRLTPPMTGSFRDGRGEFYAQDTFGGRSILVRFEMIRVNADTYRFEQAFSVDGGRTWELNWIATDRRRPVRPLEHLHSTCLPPPGSQERLENGRCVSSGSNSPQFSQIHATRQPRLERARATDSIARACLRSSRSQCWLPLFAR